MKRIGMMLLAVALTCTAMAQEEKTSEERAREEKVSDGERGGFKVEMLFTGGNLNIGYFNGVTVLGATPQLGYSVTKWLDAGIVFGYTYTSQSLTPYDKVRQSIIGPGAFVRLFPVDFLFATAQYEHNFLRQKQIYPGGSIVYKDDVNSLLLGLGYTTGKEGRNTPYYYVSIAFDVINQPNSPYRTFANEVYPVVNAGFNIPLFQGSRRNR